MYKYLIISLFVFNGCCTKAIHNTETQASEDISSHQVVEAACGQCQFGMTEKVGCDLAVRINSVNYFVEGTTIDEHGDAHADDGFCSAIRKAEVKGTIKEGKFYSEMFTLLNKNTREDEE